MLGVATGRTWAARQQFARPCLDYIQRWPHLAGTLGGAVLREFPAGRRSGGSVAMQVTAFRTEDHPPRDRFTFWLDRISQTVSPYTPNLPHEIQDEPPTVPATGDAVAWPNMARMVTGLAHDGNPAHRPFCNRSMSTHKSEGVTDMRGRLNRRITSIYNSGRSSLHGKLSPRWRVVAK
jgi:hypothetical protein